MSDFSHLDASGQPRMVDVEAKAVTRREARARAHVFLPEEILQRFTGADIQTKKGGVFQTAIVAGIMAAKRTSELIPLCHPLGLEHCDVKISLNPARELEIECITVVTSKTGVEMEALVGASVAALTVYDMCKALSHKMIIREVQLLEKTGGKSDFQAPVKGESAPLYALVLAGGQSKRMGSDKAFMSVNGRPQWEQARELLRAVGLESYVSCRADQMALFPSSLQDRLIPDTFLELGPLGGVLSAFRRHSSFAWLAVACDQPLLDEATLRELLNHRRGLATSFEGTQPGPIFDPLPSIWEPGCRWELLRLLGEGIESAAEALARLGAERVVPKRRAALTNVNTPEQLSALRAELKAATKD